MVMNTTALPYRWLLFGTLVLALAAAGCDSDGPPPAKDTGKGDAKRVKIGKNVWFEKQGEARRVVIEAAVCLDKGPLELFLTRTDKKEHEAVLAADIDARDL